MRRIVSIVALLATGLLAVGLAASPAAATPPPLHEVFTDLSPMPEIDCGAFTIRETVISGREDKITYFDDAGNPVRAFAHYSFDGVLTNLSSGATLKDHFAENDHFTIVGDDWTVVATSGVLYHYTLTGQGIEFAQTGRFIHTHTGDVIFQAGPHDEFDPVSVLCPLLA